MTFDDLWDHIQKGKKGSFRGLDMGLSRLQYYTYGIQKSTYYICFGPEGSGKSAFTINSFVCSPLIDAFKRNIDLKIRFYSLEVSAIKVLAKITSWLLYKENNILISPSILASKGKMMITKDVEDLIKSKKDRINKILENLAIIDEPLTPTQIKDDIYNFAKSRGKFYKDKNNVTRYSPNNKKEHIIVLFDTLSNLKLEANGDTRSRKGTIDLHSSYSRHIYRNILGYTVCNVMHSNRQMSSMSRAQFGEIAPMKEDIKDSSVPSQDANVVMAIFNPFEYMNDNNNLSRFMGYDIPKLKDRFRGIYLLKQRDGSSNKRVGCLFLGECGYYGEIKKSSEITDKEYNAIENIKAVFSNRAEDKINNVNNNEQ